MFISVAAMWAVGISVFVMCALAAFLVKSAYRDADQSHDLYYMSLESRQHLEHEAFQHEWEIKAQAATIEKLTCLLERSRPYVEFDVMMAGDITRHSPLDPESQARHDAQETESEKLLDEIDSWLMFQCHDEMEEFKCSTVDDQYIAELLGESEVVGGEGFFEIVDSDGKLLGVDMSEDIEYGLFDDIDAAFEDWTFGDYETEDQK